MLETAAHGYLSDQQWDELGEDWLEEALAYCAAPCRGTPGPLTRVRPRPGHPASTQLHYRLADYLEQTSRIVRRTVLAPAALWDAFMEHAYKRNVLRIAREAHRRSLYRRALLLYQHAAEAGNDDALLQAGMLLEQTGRLDEAISWYQRAAQTGDRSGLWHATRLLKEADRWDEAIALCQRAAETGNALYMRWAALLLEEADRIEEAIAWNQRAAEAGDSHAFFEANALLRRLGSRTGIGIG